MNWDNNDEPPRGMSAVVASPFYGINNFTIIGTQKAYSSNHGGGVQFVFCDGSVRLVNQTIDDTTLRRLANRRDGSVVPVDSY